MFELYKHLLAARKQFEERYDEIMKKPLYFVLVAIMGVCCITGCKKGTSIKLSDISESTILLSSSGSIQSASVEEFDKSYYDKDELKDFIKNDIATFNSKDNNEEAVKLEDFNVSDKTAKVLLTYKDIDLYNEYNSSNIQVLTMEEAVEKDVLPDTLQDAISSSEVAKADVTANSEYMVVVVDELIDIKTEGKIKYYSDAMLLNEQTAQSVEGKKTIIVYENK